ncbi:MAG: 30S ribosomal protein S6 [Chloroflexi bacterium]|jgi:small subunit ribosomal protein S6|uniref:Small ribosomal subunit protein bS6 n=1 Tax=Candidatus Thermofonsia Clade 3 bacterium TaxID=2364212 RepID=A0A2M8QBN4_9CHLR|nr:30S ribosomal protein S6 [Candidatus Roseilinea sp. NK_OTU-006]PJF47223.1 MAG: 30S ribosomal protein S6 [Candidatus Thermofonsia Clade 3 bacterium]RMG61923.1 MAG: 30S ribosomal protein S6 [Chloroflexota bacterium]
MRKYELTYIVKPDLDASARAALLERVNGFVTSEGGAVVETTPWGLRQLAYPIRNYREGYYVFSVIELEAVSLARIEQRLRLMEDIIRYLLVRADEHGGAMPSAAGAMGAAEVTPQDAPEPSAPSENDQRIALTEPSANP